MPNLERDQGDAINRRSQRRQAAYDRVEAATEWPLLVVTLLYLVVLLAPRLGELPDTAKDTIRFADWTIWSIFLAEFMTLFILAPSKKEMLKSRWLDGLIVAAPLLRPLRLARLARIVRAGSILGRAFVGIRHVTARRGLQAFLGVALAVVVAAAVFVWAFERTAAGSSIHTLGDALWWAIVTTTTVGYGDLAPVTAEGRAIAVLLMLLGISALGVVTANISAFLVESEEDGRVADLEERLAAMAYQLDRIEAALRDRS